MPDKKHNRGTSGSAVSKINGVKNNVNTGDYAWQQKIPLCQEDGIEGQGYVKRGRRTKFLSSTEEATK